MSAIVNDSAWQALCQAANDGLDSWSVEKAKTWMHNWVDSTWELSNSDYIAETHRRIDEVTTTKGIITYASNAALKGLNVKAKVGG